MADGGYLPPLVASLLAEADEFIAKIAEAKSQLEEFADTPTTAQIDGDIAPLEEKLAEARAEADAATADPIEFRIDVENATASIDDLTAAVDALGDRLDIGMGFGGLAGAVAAYHAGGGGGGGGALGAAAGAAAGGGGRGGMGGLLSALLWGGGGMLGLAGMGSLASFAGLGPEHALMTGVGLAGSAVGAGLGGGLLAGGGLGVMAVGGGSDLAVMKSTIADTQTLSKAYAQLDQAVLQYGAGSKQAAAAQENLNLQMELLGNTAGVQAEAALAQSAAALNAYWDQQTSGARVAATQIGQQFITLAHDYVPLVAQAAQTNLSIVNESLKPLFTWLEGPDGIGIFQNLESIFARNLPYAIDAFNQAVEFVLKTINYLAPATGGLVRALDELFTKANSPSGFFRWEGIMNSLIADFHLWEDLIKTVGRDIYDLFSQDAGTATAIITDLDEMLKRLGDWERSTQGQAAIHNLFVLHKQEIEQLLALLPTLLESLGKVYLTVAPALTRALTDVLGAIAPVLNAITSNAWGAWAVGLTIIAGKLGFLGTMLSPLGGLISSMLVWLGKLALGWLGVQTAADKAAASELAASAAPATKGLSGLALTGGGLLSLLGGGAGSATGSGALITGLFAGQVAGGLANINDLGAKTGSKSLLDTLSRSISTWKDWVTTAAGDIAGFFHDLPGHIADIAGSILSGAKNFFDDVGLFFQQLPGRIAGFFGDVLSRVGLFFLSIDQFFNSLPGRIVGFIGSVLGSIGNFFGNIAGFFAHINWQQLGYTVGAAVGTFLTAVASFFTSLPSRIAGFFNMVFGAIGSFFGSIGSYFTSLPSRSAGFMASVFGNIGSFFGSVGGWFASLPGRVVGFFENVVSAIGSALGTVAGWLAAIPGRVWGAVVGIADNIWNALGEIAHWVWQIPGMVWDAITGMASTIIGAIKNLAGAIGGAITGLIGDAVNFIKGAISGLLSHLPGVPNVPNGAQNPNAAGGILTEPIWGYGLWSGQTYSFAEGGQREAVVPLTGSAISVGTSTASFTTGGGVVAGPTRVEVNISGVTFQGTPERMLADFENVVETKLGQVLQAAGM